MRCRTPRPLEPALWRTGEQGEASIGGFGGHLTRAADSPCLPCGWVCLWVPQVAAGRHQLLSHPCPQARAHSHHGGGAGAAGRGCCADRQGHAARDRWVGGLWLQSIGVWRLCETTAMLNLARCWLGSPPLRRSCLLDCAASATLLAGLGTTGLNLLTGTARNPHSTAHHTGGSSSGSAAIVAAGLCPFALGALLCAER